MYKKWNSNILSKKFLVEWFCIEIDNVLDKLEGHCSENYLLSILCSTESVIKIFLYFS